MTHRVRHTARTLLLGTIFVAGLFAVMILGAVGITHSDGTGMSMTHEMTDDCNGPCSPDTHPFDCLEHCLTATAERSLVFSGGVQHTTDIGRSVHAAAHVENGHTVDGAVVYQPPPDDSIRLLSVQKRE